MKGLADTGDRDPCQLRRDQTVGGRLIAVDGARLVGLGVAIGLALAVPAARALQSIVSGLHGSPWPVLFASIGLLVATGATSMIVGPRRAVQIEPAVALRLD
jgi:hypothetical protein